MRINSINNFLLDKTISPKNSTFKGVENVYTYSLPKSNPEEYTLGVVMKLNNEGASDLNDYKNLVNKLQCLRKLAIGTNYRENSEFLSVVDDNMLLLEVVKAKGPRSQYGYFMKLNGMDLPVYVFDKENCSYTEEIRKSGQRAQLEFNMDFSNFIQRLSNKVLADFNLIRSNSQNGFESYLRKEVLEFCPKKMIVSDFKTIFTRILSGVKRQTNFAMSNIRML